MKTIGWQLADNRCSLLVGVRCHNHMTNAALALRYFLGSTVPDVGVDLQSYSRKCYSIFFPRSVCACCWETESLYTPQRCAPITWNIIN